MIEKEPQVTTPEAHSNRKPKIIIRLNSNRAILECPGIAMAIVELPLDIHKEKQFVGTARGRSRKLARWISERKPNVNQEFVRTLTFIAYRRTSEPLELFDFVYGEPYKEIPDEFDLKIPYGTIK